MPTIVPGDEYVVLAEAARMLGVSKSRVNNLINAGRMSAVKYERVCLIPLSEVARYRIDRAEYATQMAERATAGVGND